MRRTKKSPYGERNVAKDKIVKLTDKLAKQTLRVDKTRKQLEKAQKQKVASANGSLGNPTPPR